MRFMALFERLAVAAEAIAAAQTPNPDHDRTLAAYTAAVTENNRVAIEQLRQRKEWEAVEKQHMEECARKYHRERAGESISDPVMH